ncbi:MAG TPA: lipocalin-like domain-containing protein [Burkholderiales bacterium]|jgi:hypothetical protein
MKDPKRPQEYDNRSIAGRWRPAAFYSEDQASGERRQPFGESPTGSLVITEDGYVMVILTAADRQPASTAAERDKAFRSVYAYSGKYTFDGKSFVTEVDASSLVEWIGARQERAFKFLGPDRIQFVSKWSPNPHDPSRVSRGIMEFERVA